MGPVRYAHYSTQTKATPKVCCEMTHDAHSFAMWQGTSAMSAPATSKGFQVDHSPSAACNMMLRNMVYPEKVDVSSCAKVLGLRLGILGWHVMSVLPPQAMMTLDPAERVSVLRALPPEKYAQVWVMMLDLR